MDFKKIILVKFKLLNEHTVGLAAAAVAAALIRTQ
jgi:hypothetical protein